MATVPAEGNSNGSGLRSSTEFLERGAMVGSGQYSAGASAAAGAHMAPCPAPLLLQPLAAPPPSLPSPDAHSPGPPSTTAAELRALAHALEDSHDLDQHADGTLQGADGVLDAASASVAGTPSGRGHAVTAVSSSPRQHSWLEAIYSPKVSVSASPAEPAVGTGPALLVPTVARSPSTSPGRRRSGSPASSPRGSRATLALGTSPGSSGAATFGLRPTTPLQAVYGPPPSAAIAPAAASPTAPARFVEELGTFGGKAGAAAAVRASGGMGASKHAWAPAATDSPQEAHSKQVSSPSGGASAEKIVPPALHAPPTASVHQQPYTASPQPPPGGSAPINASPRPRPGASTATNARESPVASPSSSFTAPASGLLSPAAANGLLSPRSYALEPLPAHTNWQPPNATTGPSPPQHLRQAPAAAPEAAKHVGPAASAGGGTERTPSARTGGGGGSGGSRAGPQTAGHGVGGGGAAGRRGNGGARSRREELFDEEDPAVVLEQSVALLAEVEGLIRSSVGLPADQPLGAISPETANRIPGELLEALEDTLEVIAMAREELAKQERGSRPPSQQAPYTPSGKGRLSGSGGGALQSPYGSHRPAFGDRSSHTGTESSERGGARHSSTGSAPGGTPPQQPKHLPPIGGGGRAGTPLQGSSAAFGRPPAHSLGLQRSPSQQSHGTYASPAQQANHQQSARAGSASRRGSASYTGGGGFGGVAAPSPVASSVFSGGTGGAPGSARRGWSREGPPEEWMGRRQQHAEAERRKREAQLAADLRFLQQVRQRSSEVQQQHAALLAAAQESVRAARSAKAASEAQHRWLQYQDSIAEAAKRHQDTILLAGPTARLQL